MSSTGRFLWVLASLTVILLTGPVTDASALPVQGNLVVTSGHAAISSGPVGDVVLADSLAGPGFDLSFLACGEGVCLRTSPGDASKVVAPGSTFKPTVFQASPDSAPFQFYDGGTATILGVTYSGSGLIVIGPNSILFLAGT